MSSYGSPAPQGDAKATGAYAVSIAETAGSTNNDGNATDSAGNVKVDFVWGNFPIQPNDERTENQLSNTGGSTGDTGWAQTTYATAARLDFANITKNLNNGLTSTVKHVHEIVEADYSNFPAFTPGTGKYNITQVDGDGTTVTYQCFNFLNAGDTVDITGVGSFNLTSATVAKATRDYFTVTNATTGSLININNGIVQLSNALTAADGAYVSGTPFISVPNVLGLTTALALDSLKDAGYATADITTASAATNSAKTVTAASRTAGQTATTITAASHGYVAGNKVTLTSVDASVNGTYSVVSATTNSFVVNTTATTVLALTGLTGSAVAVTGTIKSQSTAAGTASVALGATITVTPWA